MSKIFEALQRSVAEKTGFPLADASDIATELLLEVDRWQDSVEPVVNLAPAPTPPIAPELHGAANPTGLESCVAVIPSLAEASRMVALTDPAGIAAEKFRLLAVRLRNLRQHRELKRVLITSAIPDEGKSLVASNLACTLGRYKQLRVLLIEGDLRRPKVRINLGLPELKGLSEYLRSDIPEDEIIYQVNRPGVKFWLMPAGEPLSEPAELLQSSRLAALMDKMNDFFDWIIVDSTPVLPVADTSIWARWSQGILMVVREGKTQKRQLQKAFDAVEGSPLLGVILNSSTNSEHKSYYTYYNSTNVVGEGPEQGK